MKKVLSAIAALAMAVSVLTSFTVANAAEVDSVSKNPIISGEVESVANGRAVVAFSLAIDDGDTFTAMQEDFGSFIGKGISGMQVTVNLDPEVFDVATARAQNSSGNNAAAANVRSDNNTAVFAFVATNQMSTWTTCPTTLFKVQLPLKDANLTADDINLTYGYCSLTIQDYGSDWATADMGGRPLYETKYVANGEGGNYALATKFGPDAPPPPSVTAPTVEITAVKGVDSVAGAYTFYFKAEVTQGTGAIEEAKILVETENKAREAYMSSTLLNQLNQIEGGFTFYVGNKIGVAGGTFTGTATVKAADADEVNDTVNYVVE